MGLRRWRRSWCARNRYFSSPELVRSQPQQRAVHDVRSGETSVPKSNGNRLIYFFVRAVDNNNRTSTTLRTGLLQRLGTRRQSGQKSRHHEIALREAVLSAEVILGATGNTKDEPRCESVGFRKLSETPIREFAARLVSGSQNTIPTHASKSPKRLVLNRTC